MNWTPQVTRLRDILASLYPTIADSRRVIQEAGYAPDRFEFSNKAIANWQNILEEALKEEQMVDELVTVAIGHYKRNTELTEAYAAYCQLAKTGRTESNTDNTVPVTQWRQTTVNTQGGTYIAGDVNVQGDFIGHNQVANATTPRDNQPSNQAKIKVLFLAANPIDTPPLKLDEEIRAIDQALRKTNYRDHFEFIQHRAVQYGDLQELLLRHQPDLLHFSGHGSETGELLLQGENGVAHPIREQTLSRLFAVLKDNIRCVVLNACYSERQAAAIAKHIDVVIGMKHELGDDAARNFAMAFYQALGYGRSIKTAFDLGCVQIDLANIVEEDEPQLIAPKIDPAALYFVTV